MENASKALIIAGAILLSILLISLGIMVYNNAKGTVNDANLDTESIQTFNGKFTQYCGNNKSANDGVITAKVTRLVFNSLKILLKSIILLVSIIKCSLSVTKLKYKSATDKSNEKFAWFNTISFFAFVKSLSHFIQLSKFEYVISTPFGLPVVPDVKII